MRMFMDPSKMGLYKNKQKCMMCKKTFISGKMYDFVCPDCKALANMMKKQKERSQFFGPDHLKSNANVKPTQDIPQPVKSKFDKSNAVDVEVINTDDK